MSGHFQEVTHVRKAIEALRGHHSASSLPAKAQAILATMPGLAPWKCGCGRQNKGASVYCGKCGHPWWETDEFQAYHTTEAATPWQYQQPWMNPPSPRDRRRPPRAQSADEKRRGPKPKGGGKADGKGTTLAEALPAPPQPIAVNHPQTTASTAAAPSVAEQQLGSLLTALQSQQGNLPPEVLQAIEGIALTSAGQEAKGLHRAVNMQQKAKQELAKLGAQRLTACSTWAAYLQKVTETVTKQLQDHEKGLKAIDEAEISWRQSLQTASAELAKFTEQRPAEEEDDAMSMEAVKAWRPWRTPGDKSSKSNSGN